MKPGKYERKKQLSGENYRFHMTRTGSRALGFDRSRSSLSNWRDRPNGDSFDRSVRFGLRTTPHDDLLRTNYHLAMGVFVATTTGLRKVGYVNYLGSYIPETNLRGRRYGN